MDDTSSLEFRAIPRRVFLVGAAATVAAAACAKGRGAPQASGSRRIDFNGAYVELAKGDQRVVFALFRAEVPLPYAPDATGTLTATTPTGRKVGPVPLRGFGIARSAGGEDAKRNPEKPSLLFVAPVALDVAGYWDVVAHVTIGGKRLTVPGRVGVVDKSQTVGVGTKAIVVATPTIDNKRGVNPICTRVPPCTMHQLSLDEALRNGKPTVAVFATPALCTSRMCGPGVDRVEDVHLRRAREANFVHVEIYSDSTGQTIAPAVKAWKMDRAGEPWVFVIGRDGVARDRMSGPVADWEVDESVGRIVSS